MTQIVLTAEQMKILQSADKFVKVCRPDGTVAGVMSVTPKEPLFKPEEIAEAERRLDSPGKWYTTQEVLDHLHSLEKQ